jgi:hypothetical protein
MKKSTRFHHARLHVKDTKSCQILIKLEFSRQFFEKILKYEMKILPVGAELFHAVGRTDMKM